VFPSRLFALLFFLSGFTSLVYQVMWMRRLSLFFGSDIYSAAITLSAFMGGLALGSGIAERVVDRLPRPLRWYGLIEIAIGLYALAFHRLLGAFEPLLRDVYVATFDAAPELYHTVRVAVAAGMLLVPTALMGATLPLVVRSFVRTDRELGELGGFFYAINTIGALAGTLAATFVLFPSWGANATTMVAVALNVVVGLLAVVLSDTAQKGAVAPRRRSGQETPAAVSIPSAAGSASGFNERHASAALWGIGVSGLAALSLEVIWTRILTQSFSATVYSFATMLACVLLGIALGSRIAGPWVDRERHPLRLLGSIELGIGVWVLFLPLATLIAPTLFGVWVWAGTRVLDDNFAAASVIAMFATSGVFMLPPTILLGATFPVAVRICTPEPSRAGFGTGRVYAANTAGAILGSLLAGFVLVPALGGRGSLTVAGMIFVANGVLLLQQAWGASWSPLRDKRVMLPAVIGSGAALLALALPRQTVLNYNVQASAQPEVIYHGEGVSHSVDIVRSAAGHVVMMVDGNIEADTSFVQRRHFILKGHLPLLLHQSPREVAVIGLGLGITLSATVRNPEVDEIQLIELAPEIVEAHAYLKEVTGDVLGQRKVTLRIDDGRNFLAMTERRFDMITADPIHPRITGVGYLYTKEYYESLRRRLKPDGVVCQWMPMYHVSRESFDAAFRTFASVFEDATFWYVRGHGLFVAGARPVSIDLPRLRERLADESVAADLASIDINGAEQLLAHLLMGPAQIQAYLAQSGRPLVNTDDNAYLEYHTPFEFLRTTKDVLTGLVPHAGFDDSVLVNATAEERAAVRAAWQARRQHLLAELDEPLR
jgi:spermidine synthase